MMRDDKMVTGPKMPCMNHRWGPWYRWSATKEQRVCSVSNCMKWEQRESELKVWHFTVEHDIGIEAKTEEEAEYKFRQKHPNKYILGIIRPSRQNQGLATTTRIKE